MTNLTLLVLAAGMGSRYGGLKQLDPMGPAGETLLDYSVYDALRAGFDRIVFVIRREFEADFRERVGARYQNRITVDYVFQELSDLPQGFVAPTRREKPWGTAHAILAARKAVTSPFLAINADDFYGSESYALMSEFLEKAEKQQFVMAGYRLRNTLSDFGTVSRGVCVADANNHLLSVREFTQLKRQGDGAVHLEADGTEVTFTGDEPVSLNFWGFTPWVFEPLEAGFREFLEKSGAELKSEFYIPTAVAEMISSRAATVDVLRTESEWFGVTYREDKPLVVSKLAAFTEAGLYPSPLWQ